MNQGGYTVFKMQQPYWSIAQVQELCVLPGLSEQKTCDWPGGWACGDPMVCGSTPWWESNEGFDLYNAYEFLDVAGEFYFDAFEVGANDTLVLEVSAEGYEGVLKPNIQYEKVIATYQDDDTWQVDPMPTEPIKYDIEMKREFLVKIPATPYLFLMGVIVVECVVLAWQFIRNNRRNSESINETINTDEADLETS